jgi:membrane protein DedA with SNARE-associated domain
MDNLRVYIENVIATLGYSGVALLMALENIFPPIPSELILPLTGFLITKGQMTFWLVLLFSTMGTLIGTTVLYYLGFYLGDARLRTFIRKYGRYLFLPESSYDWALKTFHRYDRPIVLWSRLVPGIRSIISLPAGVARMPLGRFLIYTTVGTMIWNSLLLLGGILLGQNWTRMMDFVDQYKVVVYILIAIVAVAWVFYMIFVRPKTIKSPK